MGACHRRDELRYFFYFRRDLTHSFCKHPHPSSASEGGYGRSAHNILRPAVLIIYPRPDMSHLSPARPDTRNLLAAATCLSWQKKVQPVGRARKVDQSTESGLAIRISNRNTGSRSVSTGQVSRGQCAIDTATERGYTPVAVYSFSATEVATAIL
jgi:hypothetical protein